LLGLAPPDYPAEDTFALLPRLADEIADRGPWPPRHLLKGVASPQSNHRIVVAQRRDQLGNQAGLFADVSHDLRNSPKRATIAPDQFPQYPVSHDYDRGFVGMTSSRRSPSGAACRARSGGVHAGWVHYLVGQISVKTSGRKPVCFGDGRVMVKADRISPRSGGEQVSLVRD